MVHTRAMTRVPGATKEDREQFARIAIAKSAHSPSTKPDLLSFRVFTAVLKANQPVRSACVGMAIISRSSSYSRRTKMDSLLVFPTYVLTCVVLQMNCDE